MVETIDKLKEQIKDYTRKKKESFTGVEEPWETVTLYHGTTTRYLNEILRKGITPRKENQKNNFIEVPSNDELVYLTTKWHYWYAYNANQQSLKELVGEERFNSEAIESLWNETSDFPMYIECEVPVELLTLDEDVVYQYKIKKGVRNREIKSAEDITVEMCLEQGTIASMDTILPEYISSITILGNPDYQDYLLNGNYGVDASNWFRGLGIGACDPEELRWIESTKYRNGIEIIEAVYPPENNKLIKQLIKTEDGLSIVYK